MALVNVASREIHCKIVYYGPGFGGKTTNVAAVHSLAPAEARGELVSIATETERTLFFDFLPLDLGSVEGFRVRLQIYTVPGQPMYERTRVAVLTGVDGLVFVADSGRARFRDNLTSMHELTRVLEALGRPIPETPLVIQYNKRDLPDAVPIPVLEARLNPRGVAHVEAIASQGDGVLATLREIGRLVVNRL
ncbi:MAG: gliding-motility protein MglA [Chloroflexota bacterium]|nr:MAG: gliding-motility protein MglA [Chloroflexota bacterium]